MHNESSLLVVGWEDTKAASVDSKHNQYCKADGVHFGKVFLYILFKSTPSPSCQRAKQNRRQKNEG